MNQENEKQMGHSRVLKFRAWDKKKKKMFFNVQNAYDTLGNHTTPDPEIDNDFEDNFQPSSFGDVLCDDNYVIMQFTGLLDKNSKEIYESDIVRTVVETEYGKGDVDEEVYFGGGAFYPVSTQPDETWEVIGNKFEGLQK